MAPPKRKTGGGRVTPAATPNRTSARPDTSRPAPVAASSRTTPRVPDTEKESPAWWPWMLLALLIGGGVAIMLRYLAWDSNWLTLVGLVFILAALYLATLWR